MKKTWLRKHYRGLPQAARRVLLNDHLRNNESVLRISIARMPKIYALRSALASLLRKRRRKSDAFRVWQRTAYLFRNYANPFFQRADWAMQSRSFEEAERYLRLCLLRDKGYFSDTAHFWRAEALRRLGRLNSAKQELAKVPNGFEEFWFLEYKKLSKAELLSMIDGDADK